MRHFLILVLVAVVFAPNLRAQTPDSERAAHAASVENGKTLYQSFCFVCHGGRGEGGQLGPSITTAALIAAADREIYSSIANGFVDKGMPMFGRSLTRAEIGDLVIYIRELQQQGSAREATRAKASPIATGGDVGKGEALFKGKAGCIECHSTFFTGGIVGPDLTKVAEKLGPAEIYEAVAEPSRRIARGYEAKALTTSDGKKVEGIFRNETAESVQIQSRDGKLWRTFLKKDLKGIEARKGSLMPSGLLEKLSADEARDLFAYLSDLK